MIEVNTLISLPVKKEFFGLGDYERIPFTLTEIEVWEIKFY